MTPPAASLVTVTSPEFLLGTKVMLDSFLRTNSWFGGEIAVLHSRLSGADVAALELQFPRLSCRLASPDLVQAIAALVAAFPHLADRRDRFLSLETLLLPGDWPRLFIDSDTVVCGDLSALLAVPGPLVACPDATMLRGLRRDPVDFAEVPRGAAIAPSFNAGMMLVRTAAGSPLELLDPQVWHTVVSDHTDQVVWNRLFGAAARLTDPAANFMVGHAALYPEVPPEVLVYHFNGRAKPWLALAQAEAASRGGVSAQAFAAWRRACQTMLAGQ